VAVLGQGEGSDGGDVCGADRRGAAGANWVEDETPLRMVGSQSRAFLTDLERLVAG
jgi:hypothetical protein